MKKALLIFCAATFMATSSFAAEVKLAWDKPDGSEPTGYKIYYGEAFDNLPREHVVEGIQLETTVTGLTSGKFYFFRCVALHGTAESPKSAGVYAEAEEPAPTGFHAVTQ